MCKHIFPVFEIAQKNVVPRNKVKCDTKSPQIKKGRIMSNAALPELEKRAKNASSARWEVEMCCKVEGDLSDAQIRSKWTENPWMSVMSQTLKQEIQKGSKRFGN